MGDNEEIMEAMLVLFCFVLFETGSPCVVKVGLEFGILLPQSPECLSLDHASYPNLVDLNHSKAYTLCS
jgi:hypothetical protein